MADADNVKVRIEVDASAAKKDVEDFRKRLESIADATGKGASGKSIEEIADKAEKSAPKLDKLAGAATKAGKALKTLGKVAASPLTMPLKGAAKVAEKLTGTVGKLFHQVKRVVMYRAIRSAIRMVTDGFREGTQNAYQFSKALGGTFAASMDSLATSALYLKNSLGAMAMPIINAVAPAIDWLIDKFVALLNVINQVFALLTGAKTWTKAIKYPKEYAAAAGDAAGGAGKLAKAMTTILAIDELNPLNADKGGGGGGGGGAGNVLDYSSMFEEQNLAISDTMSKMFEPFKKAWNNKGAKVVKSIRNALNGIKTLASTVGSSFWTVWTNGTGQESIEHVLGIFSGISDTIGNISRQLATGWRTDNLGTKIIQNLWNSLNSILGMWEEIATATASWAKNLDFTPAIGAIEKLTAAFDPLVKTITDALAWGWKNILLPLGKWTIEEALPAVLNAVAAALRLLNPLLRELGEIFKPVYENVIKPLASKVADWFVRTLNGMATGLDKLADAIQKLQNLTFPEWLEGFLFGTDNASDVLHAAAGAGAGAGLGPFKLEVDGIIDKIPVAKKFIDALTGIVTKRTLGTDVTASIDKLTGNITKRTLGENVTKAIPNMTGEVTSLLDKLIDSSRSVDTTARFNKSQNAMSDEQRRFYATARFNQSQNALGTPSFNARANFTDYSSEFSKVRMALQITEAYGPNGNRIQLNAGGGAFYGGQWHDIAQYATGGVPNHGSLFMAGEAGAEIVGHVGGRTEVLNQSQIASTIAAATSMSNASQNGILLQLLSGVQQLIEGQGDVRAYIPAGEVVSGLQRGNRRDGRTLVPVGV